MIKSLVLASALISNVACAGLIDDIVNYSDNYDGAFNYESDEDVGQGTTFHWGAKEYTDCMDRADKKNDRDHDRCEKDGRGERCHEQANEQYEANRAGCERVTHSDNAKETGVAWSGSGADRADSSKGGGSNGGRSRGGRESGAGSRDSGR